MDRLSRKYLLQAVGILKTRVFGLDESGIELLEGAMENAREERIAERDKAVIEAGADEVQFSSD